MRDMGLFLGIALAIIGMGFQAAASRHLSPLGEGHRKELQAGRVLPDRRYFAPKGRRYRVIGRLLMVVGLAVSMVSILDW